MLAPISVDFPPIVAKYGLSYHTEKYSRTLIPSEIWLWIILHPVIDSIFLLVRDIPGCQNNAPQTSTTLGQYVFQTIKNMKSILERKFIESCIFDNKNCTFVSDTSPAACRRCISRLRILRRNTSHVNALFFNLASKIIIWFA